MASRWGPVPLRLVVGVVFLAHGLQKLLVSGLGGTAGFLAQAGVPVPNVAAAVLIAAECLGGVGLILGLFTRWAGAVLAIDMLVAIVMVHAPGGFFAPQGVEFVLTLLAANLSLMLLGAGTASLDSLRGDR